MSTYAHLFASVSIFGESTDHHHKQISLFTNNALSSKQQMKDEWLISTLTSIRQPILQVALSIIALLK